MGRFFGDDDEMGTADVGEALRGALADSESLIVSCSPNAAGPGDLAAFCAGCGDGVDCFSGSSTRCCAGRVPNRTAVVLILKPGIVDFAVSPDGTHLGGACAEFREEERSITVTVEAGTYRESFSNTDVNFTCQLVDGGDALELLSCVGQLNGYYTVGFARAP